MKKSFRARLRKMLILGTIIPAIGFILIFFVRYYAINLESERTLFHNEAELFQSELNKSLRYYENLLDSSQQFLSQPELATNKLKKEYLNELLFIDGLEHYYYWTDALKLSSNQSMDETMIARLLSSSGEDYWVKKIDGNQELLYFCKRNKKDELLIFEISQVKVFRSIGERLGDEIFYSIWYDDSLLYESDIMMHDLSIDDNRVIHQGDSYFLWVKNDSEFKQISYTLIRDITREIKFVRKSLIGSGLIILTYLIVITFVLLGMSNILLKPINQLIDYVSKAADHQNPVVVDYNDNELKEIFYLFDEMVKTSYQNIQAIEDQTEVIIEKNKIMEDLNHQLAVSSTLIEDSTRELRIYEKQSKTLVDNIKDLMWVIDTKGRIIYINAIVEDKLGYLSEELIGYKLDNILKEDSKHEDIIHDMYYEDFEDMDMVFIKKDQESEEIFATSTKRIYHNDKLVKIQGVSRDITEERFIESQMLQKKEISNTLNEISEILTRPEKLEVLLNHIVVRIERLLNPLICTIRLIDDKGRLELMAGIGEFYTLVQEKYLDIDKDISGRAIKESKIIIVSENNEDYYDNYDEVHTIVSQSQELIFMPLEYNEGIIGVMSIGLKENITDSQLKILKVFTSQASAAIEKARMYEELENNYLNIIKALASTVEAKDAYTEDHSIRVSMYARMIAEELGMSEEEVSYIDIAGLLHDIGKIGVSDLTLTKKGRLTDEEFIEIKKHPLNGGRIVSEMKLHDHIIEGVLLHHKRFDLKGYPDIQVETLPISARIIGVADAFDAMTSTRSYQTARTFEEAYSELKRHSGTQFCPEIVGVMEKIITKLN